MEFNLCGVNPDRHNNLWPWGIKGFQEKEDEYKSLSVRPLLMNNSGLMLYYSSHGTVSYSWKRCFNSCTKQENGVVVVTWWRGFRWAGGLWRLQLLIDDSWMAEGNSSPIGPQEEVSRNQGSQELVNIRIVLMFIVTFMVYCIYLMFRPSIFDILLSQFCAVMDVWSLLPRPTYSCWC